MPGADRVGMTHAEGLRIERDAALERAAKAERLYAIADQKRHQLATMLERLLDDILEYVDENDHGRHLIDKARADLARVNDPDTGGQTDG